MDYGLTYLDCKQYYRTRHDCLEKTKRSVYDVHFDGQKIMRTIIDHSRTREWWPSQVAEIVTASVSLHLYNQTKEVTEPGDTIDSWDFTYKFIIDGEQR